jgi:serine/threonine protein phosphatase PrpC
VSPGDSEITARWASSAATYRGPKHSVNEDSHCAIDALGLFAVADGVGGHADGEVASRAIVEAVAHVGGESGEALAERLDVVEEALHAVNAALWQESLRRGGMDIIASTVVLAIVDESQAVCLWAGDSRVYLHRGGAFYQLTRDHSSPPRGSLTRAVGAQEEIEIDRIVIAAEVGDSLLLCSDGVTKVLEDMELASFLEDPLDGLAMRVIAAVVDRGGDDDSTVVIARLLED